MNFKINYTRISFFHIFLICSISICYSVDLKAQTKRALFLGNSYTNYHNLPGIVSDFAESMGDTLNVDKNTPGGYTLKGHSTNSTSINKIKAGNWDFVVLQEQSQYPSFPDFQVESEVFPYATILDTIINGNNPCAETVFYMTWGRKNGDASNCANWPPVCTYEGMDSLLRLRYMQMGADNNAIVSPVGAVWRYIRENYPDIELYAGDGSHPSTTGAYAAACCFYTVIYRKDPALSSFTNGIDVDHASIIRDVTTAIVFEHLEDWYVGLYDMESSFSYEFLSDNVISFTNKSQNYSGHMWDFGFTSDTTSNPEITFPNAGNQTVTLYTFNECGDTLSSSIDINIITAIDPPLNRPYEVSIFPNPSSNTLIIKTIENQPINYQIVQLNGSIKGKGVITIGQNEIDISLLKSGVYWIQLSIGNKEITEKFVKQ